MLLDAWIPRSLVQAFNPLISGDYDTYDPDDIVGHPPAAAQAARLSGGELAHHWPVASEQQRELLARAAQCFSDDYYHRIHINPRSLDLGNVVSAQTTPVWVWNAYLIPQTLNSITGLDEGIEVSGQPAPPLLYAALQEREYQVSVTPDGQPVLDTVLSWVFGNGEQPGLRITANRIIAWSFAPDWGEGIRERFEWLTDVMTSETYAQQRRALRTAPRRELGAPMYVEGRERQMLDLALFGWGSRVWALPIWPDIQLLEQSVPVDSLRINCETEYLDFRAGGLAMLRGESAFQFEVVEVESVDSAGLDLKRGTQQAWPAGSRLYPARPAQLTRQPEVIRLTDTIDEAEVQFLILEPSDCDTLTDLTTYRGWPVLDVRPDESEDLTRQYERMLVTLDSRTALPLVSDIPGRAMPVTGWRWIDMGRAARHWYRCLLYTLRGQQAAVWVPTHADDLTLVDTVSDAATTIDVLNVGYARFGQARAGRRDIRIELVTGQVLYRRITGASEITADIERLAIDVALGVAVEPADIARICWMALSCGASDSAEIDHVTDSEGVASAALVFRGVRDDDL
ncbi:hypothetical protein ACFSB1_01070 [Halopseudomonas phragmitis]|uniref:Uncharacterized protein n=1 Tax=Halopseudomonas phragmitis TaxID=1931241 RepID=A0A1V0B6K5_9GAMM|nr:hypothetical protein [Halopseudomonas phragmitis]AQZ95566.1 hypothetical protein BVH74_12760 [Halopseudomonas phragmitis]